MARALSDPSARMLNHAELIYAPGDRKLVHRLFEALGCRVVDPQEGSTPANLGPAAGPYLIIYLDRGSDDVIDNVMYASEVTPVQWEFEKRMRQHLEEDPELGASHRAFQEGYARTPQAMTHIGIAFPSPEEIEAALKRIERVPEFEGRVRVSQVYRPGGPGSLDDRVVQAFIHTDLCSVGLLTAGQQLELQVRLDL